MEIPTTKYHDNQHALSQVSEKYISVDVMLL